MDEIWKQLPHDIIERIACFADIDSRRALGFPPRRLVVPDLKLRFPQIVDRQFYFYGVEISPDVDIRFCTEQCESYAVRWKINGTWYVSSYQPDGSVVLDRVEWMRRVISIDADGNRRGYMSIAYQNFPSPEFLRSKFNV